MVQNFNLFKNIENRRVFTFKGPLSCLGTVDPF